MSETQTRPSWFARYRIAVVATAITAVVVGLVAWGVVASTDDTSSSSDAQSVCPATTVADEVLPSIVTLTVHGSTGSGTGSGELINGGDYILTNNHVISVGADGGTIQALFSNGTTESATLVGRTPALDLAVLKIDKPAGLPPITIGQSDNLLVGQPVVALGAPLGLDGTVTSGIVSALGRTVPVPSDDDTTAILAGAIQTDASINPGNSGGALVDCAGQLVGVNTAIATVPTASGESGGGSVGIGFAIPVDLAMRVADQLIATGTFTPPYVGVTTLPITPALSAKFGLTEGLYVQAVSPGGPGAAAGLEVGDIITKVDDAATPDPTSLFVAVVNKSPGDKVTIEYERDGQKHTTTMTLGTPPS